MHSVLRLIVLALLVLSLIPQRAAAEPDGSARRALTDDDVAREWRSIDSAQLTPDGKWFVYAERPCGVCAISAGDFNVIVRSTRSAVERRYRAGDTRGGAGRLAMSRSGRWLAWIQADAAGTSQAAFARSVRAVEISTGRTIDIADACSFSFSSAATKPRADEWIAAQACPANPSAGTVTPSGFKLMLRKLGDDRTITLDAIQSFSFNPRGTGLAYAGAEGLMLLELSSGRTRLLDAMPDAGKSYQKLTWSKSGAGLAMFRTGLTTDLVVFTRLGSASERKTALTPSAQPGFPLGFEISVDATVPPYIARDAIVWRDDEHGVFFGIRPVQSGKAAPGGQGSDVVVWHWRDMVLPAGRAASAPRDARFSFLSFLVLPEGRFMQLADDSLREVQPHTRSRNLMGFDSRAYDREQNVAGRRTRDYYRIDLSTGRRDLIIPKLALPIIGSDPVLSPDGSVLVYPDKGQYLAFDLNTGSRRNLTSALPVSFNDARNVEIAINRRLNSHPFIQGWTADETHVLISDYFDVWALPLHQGSPRNLTIQGRRDGAQYLRANFGDDRIDDDRVNLDQPIYFRTLDQKTGKTGLARRRPGTGAIESLYTADADVQYTKAAEAEVYVCEKQTAVDSPQFYLVNEWQPAKALTQLNAQQTRYAWSAGAKLINYKNARGDELQAVLHLPANYIEGKAYATIVSIYELQSQALHQYRSPQSAGAVVVTADIPRWTQHGYAILEPDIQPYVRESGAAALEAVTAAVRAAVETGVVDATRLGLEGHSYGGYETSFVVTHTDIFKAAVASAGWSNLFSAYGYVYAPDLTGIPSSRGLETNQPFIGGPWWEHWDAFVKNSPLFSASRLQTPLLLVHGERDGRVPFAQSVELFNTLRRMGDKAVVLLQYQGEGHTLAGAKSLRDLTARKMQYFDHFLKGSPAPAWWRDTPDEARRSEPATQPPSWRQTSAAPSF